jgi:hypothetical protein
MVSLVYFSFSLGLYFKYGVLSNIPSFIIFVVSLLTIVSNFVFFYFDLSLFGNFVRSFQLTRLFVNHYIIYSAILTTASLLLVLVPQSPWAPSIPIALLAAYTVILSPYNYTKENLRSAFNLLVMCSFVGFRVYLTFLPISNVTMYLLLGIMGGLSLMELLSFLSMVYRHCTENQSKAWEKLKLEEKHKAGRVLVDLMKLKVSKTLKKVGEDNIFKEVLQTNYTVKAFSDFRLKEDDWGKEGK